MANYLAPTAEIVHSPHFASAIVKLQNDLPISADELHAVDSFVLSPSTAQAEVPAATDFATSILRQAKKPRLASQASVEYDPLLLCAPPTSNMCERLFSECKLVFTSLRSSTLPANLKRPCFFVLIAACGTAPPFSVASKTK
eukprot:jgi/Phyca11/126131/e_gw1.61.254.1